jgi:heat-inducible transcriptional repressor
MADLEESGYLKQPHTSAGRIPSHQGYRYYVNTLMEQKQLTDDELAFIKAEFDPKNKPGGYDSILQRTAKILSEITKYPSLILTPRLQEARFRHIHLVAMDSNHLLGLVVTDTGFVENILLETPVAYTQDELNKLSAFLNSKLQGVSLVDFGTAIINQLKAEVQFGESFDDMLQLLLTTLGKRKPERIYVDGTINILEQPEFKQVEKFKLLMSILEEEKKILNLMNQALQKRGLDIRIGEEIKDNAVEDCSMVTATYEVDGRILGAIGVLGPTRMDYGHVVTVVDFVAKCLGGFLSEK